MNPLNPLDPETIFGSYQHFNDDIIPGIAQIESENDQVNKLIVKGISKPLTKVENSIEKIQSRPVLPLEADCTFLCDKLSPFYNQIKCDLLCKMEEIDIITNACKEACGNDPVCFADCIKKPNDLFKPDKPIFHDPPPVFRDCPPPQDDLPPQYRDCPPPVIENNLSCPPPQIIVNVPPQKPPIVNVTLGDVNVATQVFNEINNAINNFISVFNNITNSVYVNLFNQITNVVNVSLSIINNIVNNISNIINNKIPIDIDITIEDGGGEKEEEEKCADDNEIEWITSVCGEEALEKYFDNLGFPVPPITKQGTVYQAYKGLSDLFARQLTTIPNWS